VVEGFEVYASLPEGVGWAGLMKIKEMSWRRVEHYRF
jgi:hypothetical protein